MSKRTPRSTTSAQHAGSAGRSGQGRHTWMIVIMSKNDKWVQDWTEPLDLKDREILSIEVAVVPSEAPGANIGITMP